MAGIRHVEQCRGLDQQGTRGRWGAGASHHGPRVLRHADLVARWAADCGGKRTTQPATLGAFRTGIRARVAAGRRWSDHAHRAIRWMGTTALHEGSESDLLLRRPRGAG